MDGSHETFGRRDVFSVREMRHLIDRFEEALFEGKRPRIDDMIPAELHEREIVLEELIHVEIEYFGKRYERVSFDDYLSRFPEIAQNPDAVARIRKTFDQYAAAVGGDAAAGSRNVESASLAATIRQPLSANEQLLFGIVALQSGLVTSEQLVAAFSAWVQDKSRALPDLLVGNGMISLDDRQLIEQLVEKFVDSQSADFEQCLGALSASDQIRDGLRGIPDSDLHASLDHIGRAGSKNRMPTAAARSTGSTRSSGRFRILRPHAKGGLGQVSVALDQELNREVALKEIQPQHADNQTSRERFLVEAEITGGLEHPGIVPVYALGQRPDGRPFYAMRFVKGDSLKQAIELFHRSENPDRKIPGARRLALRELLRRFVDVCNAVEYAHSRGVLHRDLKPGNIMVGKYGETLVVDWGLAKTLDQKDVSEGAEEPTLHPLSALGSSEHTQPGSAVGTPAYMSPEQAAGKLETVGPASDVYSLGATLYHLLTGLPPFDRSGVVEVLRKVQAGDFRRPRQVAKEIPKALEAICLKAMSLAPADRYPTPRRLADDLEHWLADEPVQAAPEELGERLSRLGRRHRGAVRAGAVALLLLALISILATIQINNARNDALGLAQKNSDLAIDKGKLADEKGRLAEEKGRLAEENGKLAVQQGILAKKNAGLVVDERKAREAEANQTGLALQKARELRRSLYLSDMNRVEQDAAIGNVERMRMLLGRHVPKAEEEDLRGFDWHYWWNHIHRDSLSIETGGPVQRVAASSDGRWIAIGSLDGRLHVVDAQTGARRKLALKLPDKDWAALAFTSDGQQIVGVGTQGGLKVWETETGRVVRNSAAIFSETRWEDQYTRWPAAISPNGKTVLARHPLTAVMGKWSGAKCLYLNAFSTGPYVLPEASKNLDPRVQPLHQQTLRFVEAPFPMQTNQGVGEIQPAINHDPSAARNWTAGDVSAPPKEAWGISAFGLAVSPSNKLFADGGREGDIRLWNADTLRFEKLLAEHKGIVWDLAFSPDEQYLASAGSDGMVIVWDLVSGKPLTHCYGSPRALRSVVFLPGRSQVAAGGDDGALRIWDQRTGNLKQTFHGHLDRITSLSVATGKGPREMRIVSGSLDGSARVWNVDESPDVLIPKSYATFFHAVSNSDGTWIATGDIGANIHIWDRGTNKHRMIKPPVNVRGMSAGWSNATYSAARNRLAISYLASIAVWNVEIDKIVFQVNSSMESNLDLQRKLEVRTGAGPTFVPKVADFLCIDLSPDARLVAAGCSDGQIRIWDIETQKIVRTWKSPPIAAQQPFEFVRFLPDGSGVFMIQPGTPNLLRIWKFLENQDRVLLSSPTRIEAAVSPDSSLIAVCYSEGLKFLEPGSGSVVASLTDEHDQQRCLDFSPDGLSLLTYGTPGIVRVWDVKTREEKHRLMPKPKPNLVKFVDGGRTVALPTQGIIDLWHLEEAAPTERLLAASGPVHCAEISMDGQWLASASRIQSTQFNLIQDEFVLFNLVDNTSRENGPYMESARPFIGFIPDGSGILSNAGIVLRTDFKQEIKLKDWNELGTLRPGRSGGHAMVPLATVAADGKRLAVVDEQAKGIQIWESQSSGDGKTASFARTTLLVQPLSKIADLAFSPDGSLIATADDAVIRIWKLEDQTSIELKGHSAAIQAIAWSNNGSQIASAGSDATVRLWNLAEMREQVLFRGHSGSANAVAFPNDDRTVITGGADGNILVWDQETGEIRLRLKAHMGPVRHLSFWRKGGTLVSSGDDGHVKLWRTASDTPQLSVTIPAEGVEGDQTETSAPPPPSSEPDRRAAAWLIQRQISFGMLVDGKDRGFNPDPQNAAQAPENQMPAGEFYIQYVDQRFHSNRKLTDEDLAQLSGLSKLKNLGLQGSAISAQGLRHLMGLVSLQALDLSKTSIEGADFSALVDSRELTVLNLAESKLTDMSSESLGRLSSVEDLNLNKTDLPGIAYDAIARLGKLKKLSLVGVDVGDQQLARLGELAILENLAIDKTKAGDLAFETWQGFKALKSLSADGTNVTDAALARLPQLPSLSSLMLNETNITDQGIESLCAIRNLNYLGLHQTKVTLEGVTRLAKLRPEVIFHVNRELAGDNPDLQWVLTGNSRTWMVDGLAMTVGEAIDRVRSGSKLTVGPFSLSNLQTGDSVLRLKGLKTISIRQTGIKGDHAFDDDDLKRLSAFQELESLRLNSSGITDAGLIHLKELPKLAELDLSGTKVTSAGMIHLAELPNLTSLNVSGTKVTLSSIAKHLPNLRELRLTSPAVPPDDWPSLESLTRLELLDLENTRPTDEIGPVIVKLKGLRFVKMQFSGNRLKNETIAAIKGVLPIYKMLYFARSESEFTPWGQKRWPSLIGSHAWPMALTRTDDSAKAALAFAAVFQQSDINLGRWWATMLLDAGNVEGYRDACKQVANRFGATQDGEQLVHLTWTLMLAPGSDEEKQFVGALATRLVMHNPDQPWNQTALATSQIHLRQFDAALQSLDRSDEVGKEWASRIINDFLRVIALRDLSRTAEARPIMDRANKYWDEHLKRTPQAPFGDWITDEFGDWFAIKHFRNEAEKLLRE